MFAVESEGVEDFVLKHYKDNVPASKISQMLKEDKDVKISPLSINRWLKKQREKDLSEKGIESKEKFDNIVMNYTHELKSILDEIKEIKAIAIQEGKLDTYAKLVGKIYDGLNLFAKINGDIQQKSSGSMDINIIINEINKETFGENKQLRNKLHGFETIDVEAEILEEDKEEEKKLRN